MLMDRYRKTILTAILTALIMMTGVCFSGCDLFSVKDDGEDIEANEDLEVPGDAGVAEDEYSEIVDPDDPTTKNYDNGITYKEEAAGAKLEIVKADPEDFVGSWEAKSGDAHYLFGNLDLTIKENGRWTANITDEDLRGTWKEKNGGIYLEGNVLNAQLNFTKDKKLLFLYHPDEDSSDYVTVVLTAK